MRKTEVFLRWVGDRQTLILLKFRLVYVANQPVSNQLVNEFDHLIFQIARMPKLNLKKTPAETIIIIE